MKKAREHVIKAVEPGSIAEELELSPGDVLVSVNGQPVRDVLDYHYLINEEYLELLVRKPDGEEWELEIEKEYEDDLGIEFENGLMDDYRSCSNRCIFCFIDQLPEGMRDTLYFKDDDSRLSFLQGNYVTLTNMSDEDVERIITYHLEPINISFHTMNPELRCRMLHNRFAGEALKKADRFFEAGVMMNGQIVLCKGINDGPELEASIERLAGYLPYLQSVSVVPVGLTSHREGLYPLKPFTKEDAEEVLDLIHGWQERLYREHGTHFIHAGDEWYLLAGRELPEAETYDGYLQLENGVGMVRLFREEIREELEKAKEQEQSPGAEGRRVTVATGRLAAPILQEAARAVEAQYPEVRVQVLAVENRFFGERITVAGLLTGRDLKEQLSGRELGDALLLTENMFRDGTEAFLDDMTAGELSGALQVPITIVKSDGKAFLEAVLGLEKEEKPKTAGTEHRGKQPYEHRP
ncbi:Fe/S oxidoreductase [Lachnoclostridium sp. An131]|uniref:DUF512 domain-containing protein n=1 Tax=Lachnoclostridium sp. An131 TaxID=1965555 RepID=UPI000B3817FE|nr:DUF512 domain-containing protein [Lachnoclostridium sp. An131]OUQ27163.1 Fe/S oxidoreductase [Lachnoclostridium sp. An131]